MTISSTTTKLAASLILLAGAGLAADRVSVSSNLDARIMLFDENTQQTRQVSEHRTFYDGQRFKINVRPAQNGYLYVLCRTSQGEVKILHPTEAGENHVGRGQAISFPERGWFRFDQDPGTERLYLVLSEKPILELDQAVEDGTDLTTDAIRPFVDGAAMEQRGITVTRSNAPWTVKQIVLRHEQGEQ